MYGLFVKYNGDSHFTRIMSDNATGTVQQISRYLAENWQYIEYLGGSDKVKIKRVSK